MSSILVRATLRAVAIAIAIAALIDPAFSSNTPKVSPVVVVHLTSNEPDAVDRGLRSRLDGRELIMRAAAGNRLPCALDEHCVVVADGSIDVDWNADVRPVSLISIPQGGQPNVTIRSAVLSGGHAAAAGAARIELSGQGVEGKRTEVRIVDGGAVVGLATHQWSAASTATIDVAWWPIGLGARALRIEAMPVDGETTVVDNHLDAGITISGARTPVLVFDARPSWSSTFVRRALEDDARFTVGYRSRIAPALSTGTANGKLDAASLDVVPLVIVGGPEALTSEEVALLERYVRVRGGTLVLLPEQRVSGASSRLFAGEWTEHLTAKVEAIGPLRATEVLRTDATAVTTSVIARSGPSAAIVSAPAGEGRIVVSGAMDAWRYRHLDTGAFDRFWRSVAAQGAAAGLGLSMRFDRAIASAGSRARFTLRDRRFEPPSTSEASVVSRCNNGAATTVRVWPSGIVGEFAGELPAAAIGECTVEATVGDRQVSAAIAIVDRPSRGAERTLTKLERQARDSGGAVASVGKEAAIASAIDAAPPTMSRVVSVHPMRAPWWILPFAGCLSRPSGGCVAARG